MSAAYLCCSFIKQQGFHSSWAKIGPKAVFALDLGVYCVSFWHLVFQKGNNQWTWVITVKRGVGGRNETVDVVIFILASLHPWWVCNSWGPWSQNDYINVLDDKQRRLSITASSEKLRAAAWCDLPETTRPPWQLPPHSTANYGCCRFNTVLENKEEQELVV